MSCTILVVEDDYFSRRNYAIFLQRATHRVFEAQTGESALQLISQNNFDIVVSDFRLPGIVNGIDVLRYQSEMHPGTRLILITAFGSTVVQSETKALGAFYMEKPISLNKLLVSIHSTP